MALCEAAAYYKKQGLTLWDQMIRIFEKYGYYREGLQSITLKGIEGDAKIQAMMEKLRANTPKNFAGFQVQSFRDYEKDTITDVATGAVTPTGLPKSNVLYYDLNDGAWCCARPSGTEPKVKFYMGVKGTSFEDAEAKLKELSDAVLATVQG